MSDILQSVYRLVKGLSIAGVIHKIIMRKFEATMEDLEDFAAVVKRKDEPAISLYELKMRLGYDPEWPLRKPITEAGWSIFDRTVVTGRVTGSTLIPRPMRHAGKPGLRPIRSRVLPNAGLPRASGENRW